MGDGRGRLLAATPHKQTLHCREESCAFTHSSLNTVTLWTRGSSFLRVVIIAFTDSSSYTVHFPSCVCARLDREHWASSSVAQYRRMSDLMSDVACIQCAFTQEQQSESQTYTGGIKMSLWKNTCLSLTRFVRRDDDSCFLELTRKSNKHVTAAGFILDLFYWSPQVEVLKCDEVWIMGQFAGQMPSQ